MDLATIFQAQPTNRWPRGGRWAIEVRATDAGEQGHFIVPDPSSFPLSAYEPVTEAPEAYLAFAKLVDYLWVPESEPSIGQQCHTALNFVQQYGPLDVVVPSSQSRPTTNFTVEDVIREASHFAAALRCYQALEVDWGRYHPAVEQYLTGPQGSQFVRGYQGARHQFELSTREGVRDWLRYNVNVYQKAMWGVYHLVLYDQSNSWQHGYSYNSLVTAMWLQLFLTMLQHSLVRHCEGCGILFEADRTNQSYHNASCRTNANARRTYWRKRGGEQR